MIQGQILNRFLCCCLFLSILQSGYSQQLNHDWAYAINGLGDQNIEGMDVLANGKILGVGSYEQAASFGASAGGQTPAPIGYETGYVVQYDSNGVLDWISLIGGSASTVQMQDVAHDPLGNIYVIGRYDGLTDFDPGLGTFNMGSVGGYRSFLLKLSPTGAFISAGSWGCNYCIFSMKDIVVDPHGSLYLAGSFNNTVDFDPASGFNWHTSIGGDADSYLMKLGWNLSLQWVKTWGNSCKSEAIVAVTTDTTGNPYVVGEFLGTLDIDPGTGTVNMFSTGVDYDLYLLKLTPNGDLAWSFQIGGQFDEYLGDLKVRVDGTVLCTGGFMGLIDFDPGVGVVNYIAPQQYEVDGFLLAVTPAATFDWVRVFDGNGRVITQKISETDNGDIYLSGAMRGQVDVDPSQTATTMLSAISDEWFLLHLDPTGNYMSSIALEGDPAAVSNAMVRDAAGGIYLGGDFSGGVDFDPGYAHDSIWGVSNNSVFLLRLKPCAPSPPTILTTVACDSFAWQGKLYRASGTYVDAVSNLVGCDSNLILNLTIHHSFSDTITATTCSPFTLNNTTYAASGVYVQSFSTIGGCDSIITLQLTVNSPSDTTLTEIGCNTYTLNGVLYNASGTYTQVRPNAQGCDSTITLQLTVHPTAYGIVRDTSCTGVTVNGHTYTSTGIFVQQFTSSVGCDSVLAVDVRIYSLNWSISHAGNGLISNQAGANAYQWLDCNNGYAPIPGATSQTFMPTTSGYYALDVTLWHCRDTSSCLQKLVVGTANPSSSALWALYPNPTSGKCALELDRTMRLVQVCVLDISGKVLFKRQYTDTAKPLIDLGDLAQGVYFLEVVADDVRQVFKVVKN